MDENTPQKKRSIHDTDPIKPVRPKEIRRDLEHSIQTYYRDIAAAAGTKEPATDAPEPRILEEHVTEETAPEQTAPPTKPQTPPQPDPAPQPQPKAPAPPQPEQETPPATKVETPAPQEPVHIPRDTYSPNVSSLQDTQPQQKTRDARTSVRTFYSDVAETVKKEGMSITDIALAEQRRKQGTLVDETKKERSGIVFAIVTGFVLLSATLGVLGFLFLYERPDEPGVAIRTTLIRPDQETLLDVTGQRDAALFETLTQAYESADETIGTVTAFVPVESTSATGTFQQVDGRALLDRLATRAPSAFVRNLASDIALGVHHLAENEGFMILTTASFESAFAGMLDWEPFIAEDISFVARDPAEPNTVRPVGGAYQFEDHIVANHDTRALTNTRGDIRLIYSFPDQRTLIIASNEDTLTELLRLRTVIERQ